MIVVCELLEASYGGLRFAGMGTDGGLDGPRASVMEEAHALSQSPQRRGAPISTGGMRLNDAVVERWTHGV